MARPDTYKGSSVALFLEGLTPGTFIRPCGLNNHTVSFSKNATEIVVPDCDDPDLPAWIERGVESLDMTGSGSGILAAEAVDRWWAAFSSTDSVPARIYIGALTDVVNGRFWEGNIHITGFEVTGERGPKAQVNVSWASDGEITFNPTTA